ncbi:MAG: PQQ-dependent sugar dehydrogenase, partial [Verrucomicrobiae bacterium]|nr:PQQ-dependent sugar dehydrogenase [Verrucomicrobiae bacterium]
MDAFPGLTFPSGQDNIISIAVPPGRTNELYVTGQRGKIFVITNLARPTKTVFLDITSNTFAPGGEPGLVGLAFHPRYQENGYFYVTYTRTNHALANMYDVVSRFQRDPKNPWQALPGSEQILIAQLDVKEIHQAGDLHFGPDGYLYVSLGDGGGTAGLQASQRIDRDFFGGILRLDVDGRPGNLAPNPHPAIGVGGYWIPADNPFVGADQFNGLTVNPEEVRTEFWAVGFRNPFRIAFDSLTGDLYGGDVGDVQMEEVNRIVAGGNYGWGYYEGTLKFRGTPPPGYQHVPPLYAYGRSDGDPNFQGACVIGGPVYRGTLYPELSGQYLFTDYASRHLWALPLKRTGAAEVWKVTTGAAGIVGFGLHPATGEILGVERRGRIAKLTYSKDRS